MWSREHIDFKLAVLVYRCLHGKELKGVDSRDMVKHTKTIHTVTVLWSSSQGLTQEIITELSQQHFKDHLQNRNDVPVAPRLPAYVLWITTSSH